MSCERTQSVIETIPRPCLDFLVPLGPGHSIGGEWVGDYNGERRRILLRFRGSFGHQNHHLPSVSWLYPKSESHNDAHH